MADEALPNREHFATILPYLDPHAEKEWVHQISPEDFWSSLFARGTIHHPLYSHARAKLSSPQAAIQASEGQGTQIGLSDVLVSHSKSANGRELVLGFFQSLPSLESYRISNVIALMISEWRQSHPSSHGYRVEMPRSTLFGLSAFLKVIQVRDSV